MIAATKRMSTPRLGGERHGYRRLVARSVLAPCAEPATAAPYKGRSFAIRVPPWLGSVFYLITTGRRDVSLYCSLLVPRQWGGPNSRFGRINSRLGGRKFPVRTATGNGSQEVDFTDRFRVKTAPETGKSKKIPASTGKTGNPIPRGHVPGWPSAPALAGAARCRYSRLVRPGELKE